MEVLVALAVAALLLTAFARAFGAAWDGNKRPLDDVVALAVARDLARQAASDPTTSPEGRVGRFSYVVSRMPLNVEQRPSRLAPMPPGLSKLNKPGRGDDAGAILQRLTVTIRMPSGRSLSYDTIATDRRR